MKRVTSEADIPSGPHFAILVYKTSSVYHEGDERSRTNPGHGYPAYTETIESFEHFVTTNHGEWVEKVTQLETERVRNYNKFTFACLEVARKGAIKVEVSLE